MSGLPPVKARARPSESPECEEERSICISMLPTRLYRIDSELFTGW